MSDGKVGAVINISSNALFSVGSYLSAFITADLRLSVTKILGTPDMASMHFEMAYRKSSTRCDGIHSAKA